MENETVSNPFGSVAAAKPQGALAASDQQRSIAEVQAAMMIARANPRDPIAAMDRILNACTRPGLANAAVYNYARGGTDISGPSIRLAETIAQNWGNFSFGMRELEQRDGSSVVQAYAWDMETNVRREVAFQVAHKRVTKTRTYDLEDPRDIYEMVANQGARRLRSCVLAVVPGDVIEAAVSQCELTMKAHADISPEAMAKMLELFKPFGVTKEHVETRIQRRMDAIQPAQVVTLRKVYMSLRDGMSTAAEWFDIQAPVDARKTTGERLKDAALRKAAPKTEAPPEVEEKVDTNTGEITSGKPKDFAPPAVTLALLLKKFSTAKSVDVLEADASLIGELDDVDERNVATSEYQKLRRELLDV